MHGMIMEVKKNLKINQGKLKVHVTYQYDDHVHGRSQ